MRKYFETASVVGICFAVIMLIVSQGEVSADSLFPTSMKSHYIAMSTVPASPTDVYSSTVWLKSIELIPQSTTSPTCTIQDKAGSPNVAYNAVTLSANHSYRDERSDTNPLLMTGGITWSCTDTTVKAQLIVMY